MRRQQEQNAKDSDRTDEKIAHTVKNSFTKVKAYMGFRISYQGKQEVRVSATTRSFFPIIFQTYFSTVLGK